MAVDKPMPLSCSVGYHLQHTHITRKGCKLVGDMLMTFLSDVGMSGV